MERKTRTIDLKGKSYAQVKDRLQEFWKANPRGFIKTDPQFLPDGQIHFTATVVKEKGNGGSAEATGHSVGKSTGEKAFEKLETIAVGRALAMIGYASDGEIASSEEMEEFLASRAEKVASAEEEWDAKIRAAKTIEDLQQIWPSVPAPVKKALNPVKDEMKELLASQPV